MTSKHNKKEIPWFNYVGFAILAVCYLGALWNVVKVSKDELFEGKKVIRICHWQLELGYRDAMRKLIDKYEKLHPDVKIVQIPVSERTYGQWVTTQLIGRTAPDLIEMGMFNVKDSLPRYFVPITKYLREPNPYNASNPEFAKTPWMDTFYDGLQSSYIPELVDYFTVGFNTFTVRIFYNKTLFRKLLGTDKPPKDLAEFFEYCERIKRYSDDLREKAERYNAEHGTNKVPKLITPIASAKYQTNLFKSRYMTMFTFDQHIKMDADCDGKVRQAEFFAGVLGGNHIVDNYKFEIVSKLMRRMADYFPRGFMSLGRMDSGFSFVQSRAGMITSGSWDASSYVKQAAEQPFGDVIKAVNGRAVNTAAEVEKALMSASASAEVSLKLSNEGMIRRVRIKPTSGETMSERYGMVVEDAVDRSGKKVPVVTSVLFASPAERAGIRERQTFEVGVFDFPLPLKTDPKYGRYVVGKVAELAKTAGAFGLCKFSKHKDVAIDFLRFCTTPENNELFNDICQWMPVVKGAKVPKALIPFKPHPEGYYGALGFSRDNQRSSTLAAQAFWPFISGSISYEQYKERVLKGLPESLARDYVTLIRATGEQIPDRMIRRSSFLAEAVFAEDSKSDDNTAKLASAWDVLRDSMCEESRRRALMRPFVAKPDADDFNKKFFK